MSARLHHVGLQADDIDKTGAFYEHAFGARWLVKPVTFEGAGAEQAMGAPGTRLKVALLDLDGVAIELFQFLAAAPDWARQPKGRLPHLAVQVEDTDRALACVEQAGGRRVWPQVDRFGKARVIYVADPDGNVVELLDRPPADIAASFLRWFPDAAPDA